MGFIKRYGSRFGFAFALLFVLYESYRPLTSLASSVVTSAYNLVQSNGTPLVQRTTLNCTTGMTCVDSGGVTQMSATGSGGSVTEVNILTTAPLAKSGTCDVTTTGTCTLSLSANNQIRTIGASFDGAGSALTTGAVTYFTVPFACTIAAWNITVDTGTITFDIWKIATGTAIPTVANTITAAALPAISSGTAVHSTTLTGWTTSVAANDIFGFDVNAVSGATKASITLQCNATT